jgi:hypothetical protein
LVYRRAETNGSVSTNGPSDEDQIMIDATAPVLDSSPFVPRILPASDVAELPTGFEPLRLAIPDTGRVLNLMRPDMVAGRHSQCEIYLADPEVSRRHCRFVFHGGTWAVEDLHSLNGIHVNDEKVTSRSLKPGDIVRIGGFTLVVQAQGGNSAEGTAVLRSIADAIPAERRKAS